ncbi:hypothetical protein SDC9_195002 [bioreactor metagenome]|uniref:3-hydroxyacyl-CoA dehydrogenase C-terminal domain-containing protein n=1 Tax=bioreactor metagenome TaxID=1076179 RepID=A0A645I8E3_9ZZZZ
MKDLCKDSGVSPLLQKAMDQGALGAKTGTGLYDWSPEGLARIKKIREDNLLEWLQKDKEIEL